MKEDDKELDEIIQGILEERAHLNIAKFLESLDTPYGPISLFTRQIQLIKHIYDEWHKDEIVINKARQSGVTRLIQGFLIYKCIKEKNKYVILYVCNNLSNSAHILNQINDICVLNGVNHNRKNIRQIEINGNIIINVHSKIPQLNGRKLVVIYDEYAHIITNIIRDIENRVSVYSNVLKLYVSTPNGMNDFYDKCNSSQINVFNINWKDVPSRIKNWKKIQIQILGSEEVFEQEYNNQFISKIKV